MFAAFREILEKHLPPESLDIVLKWTEEYPFHLTITRKRQSKYGDYRPPQNGRGHRISVNHDLSPFEFLITYLHELAHLRVQEKYRKRVKPHGPEWQAEYGRLLKPLLDRNVFPAEVAAVLSDMIASGFSLPSLKTRLSRALKALNGPNNSWFLEDLPQNALFAVSGGRVFRKQQRMRKRYRCLCLNNRRMYLVDPLMEVFLLEETEANSSGPLPGR